MSICASKKGYDVTMVTYNRSKSYSPSSTTTQSTQTSNVSVSNSQEHSPSTTTSSKKTMTPLSDLLDSSGDSSPASESLLTLQEMLSVPPAPRKRKRSFDNTPLTSSSSTETKSNETSPSCSDPSVLRSVPGLYSPSIIQAASTTGTVSTVSDLFQNVQAHSQSLVDLDSAKPNSPEHSVITFMCKECGASMTLWGGIGTGTWYGTTSLGMGSGFPTSNGWGPNQTSG